MRLDFRDNAPINESRRPPPNYRSRWIQLRLLVLVSLFMLVLIAANEARNPKYYRWLGFEVADGAATSLESGEVANEDVDTRLQNMPKQQGPTGTVTVSKDNPKTKEANEHGKDGQIDILQQESIEQWTKLLSEQSHEERKLLFKVLRSSRKRQALANDEQIEWLQVLTKFDEGWKKFFDDSGRSIVESDEGDTNTQRQIWLHLLSKLEERWNHQKDALMLASEGRVLTNKDKHALAHLQSACDQFNLALVEDNTLRSRWQEHDAWYRLLEQCQSSTIEELEKQSLGRVGYLQLYRQPEHYRGKIVTIRGTARSAYRAAARKNVYDIEKYYVFVVKPAGGPNSPMFIYSLNTPTGFPVVTEKSGNGTTTTLDHEVEFTAFYFKNCAYRAKDTTRVAPMLIGKVPTWEGNLVTEVAWWQKLPSATAMICGLLVIAAISVLLAVFVYRHNQGQLPTVASYDATNLSHPERLKRLEKEEIAPSVTETLNRLSAEAEFSLVESPTDESTNND